MRRGQISMFILVAFVIVVILGISIYVVQNTIQKRDQQTTNLAQIPQKARPIEQTIITCITEKLEDGVQLLNQQGGRIAPDKSADETGNPSTIDHYGIPIQKWRFKGQNGIVYPIPSIEDMQKDLESHLALTTSTCFTNFTYDEPIELAPLEEVYIEIKKENIYLTVEKPISIFVNDAAIDISSHKTSIESNLETSHETARKIIESEKNNYYLENKTLDILSAYDEIPLAGTEVTCDTLIWNKAVVEDTLRQALEANIEQLTTDPKTERDKYYLWDIDSNPQDQTNTNFRYNRNWPIFLEITPSDGNILSSKSIRGEGIVAAALCINEYQFLYTVTYPVVVRIERNDETFQFGLDVRIQGNQAEELVSAAETNLQPGQLCAATPNLIDVTAVDQETGELLDPRIKLHCGQSVCSITNNAFPSCVGGSIILESDGYVPTKLDDISTIDQTGLDVSLSPLHTLELDVQVITPTQIRPLQSNENAVLSLGNSVYDTVISYPQTTTITLGEGDFELNAQLFLEGSRTIKGGADTQCIKVPRASIFGLAGLKKEECVSTNVEDLVLDSVVVGTGFEDVYFSSLDLSQGKRIVIYIDHTGIPRTFRDLKQEDVQMTRYPEVLV